MYSLKFVKLKLEYIYVGQQPTKHKTKYWIGVELTYDNMYSTFN